MRDRMAMLSEMLSYAVDVATCQEEPYLRQCSLECIAEPDLNLWKLIAEAEGIAKEAEAAANAVDRVAAVLNWMETSQKFWLGYRIEYSALVINTGADIPGCRIPGLGIELAELAGDARC